jgi:hypothetical protein
MSRARSLGWGVAMMIVLAAIGAQSADAGGAFDTYQTLGGRRLSPAPLVPVSLPPSLGALATSPLDYAPEPHGGYYLSFKNLATDRAHLALLLIKRNAMKSLSAERRTVRSIAGVRATHVRGHAGLLLTYRFEPLVALVWNEDRRLYEVATGTPRTISLGQLRAAAARLEHLLGAFYGHYEAPDRANQEVETVVTDNTITIHLGWSAPCVDPSVGYPLTDEGAEVKLWNVPVKAGAFSLAPFSVNSANPSNWSLSLSGTASPSGGQITFQTFADKSSEHCAIGPLSIDFRPIPGA